MYVAGWGDETRFDMVIDDGKDIDMHEICGCIVASTLNTCEANCSKYYGCSNIGLANSLLAAYEKQKELANIDIQALQRVRAFLKENAQYGDDWEDEIQVLDKAIDLIDQTKKPIR